MLKKSTINAIICSKVINIKIRTALCVCRLREGIQQDTKKRAVILLKNFKISRSVCKSDTNMYDHSITKIKIVVEKTEEFCVKVKLHQEINIESFLICYFMDRLTDVIQNTSPKNIMFR